nr:hypothetical protein BaRGS_033221 [Batillaria attramentaria]
MLSGVNVLSNSLRFGGGGENVVLIPYLANNGRMFIKDFGIQITFRVDDTQSNAEMDILSNEDAVDESDSGCHVGRYAERKSGGIKQRQHEQPPDTTHVFSDNRK